MSDNVKSNTLEFKSFRKKYFAVIGNPIFHSMSPFIHTRLFELSHLNAEYKLIDIAPEILTVSFSGFKIFDGFNVTIPHKRSIMSLLDSVSKKALTIGSVNTVNNKGFLKGYNTDPTGFLKAINEEKIPINGKVVILGSGGVARAIAYEVATKNCELIIATRPQSLNSAITLAENIKIRTNNTNVKASAIEMLNEKIDLLINATPVGMHPNLNEMPVSCDVIKNSEAVFDVVYNPIETLFIKTAKSFGVKAMGGTSMLIWQAVESQRIWNESEFELNDILQLIEDTKKEIKHTFNY